MRPSIRVIVVVALLLLFSWILFGSRRTRSDRQPDLSAGAAMPSSEPLATSTPLLGCRIGDEVALGYEPARWKETLVDTYFALPIGYVPDDLVDLSTYLGEVSRFAAAPGLELREEAARHLGGLFEDAEGAGVYLEVVSAYRSFDYQRQTFDHWVVTDGYDLAIRTSARAGHSEHQLGAAVDLRTRGGEMAWDVDDWGGTPEGAWVNDNAWRFGFVLSYPPGKEDVTCYAYEPWHYRYVGTELAEAVRSSGFSLREYLLTFVYGETAAR